MDSAGNNVFWPNCNCLKHSEQKNDNKKNALFGASLSLFGCFDTLHPPRGHTILFQLPTINMHSEAAAVTE